MLLSTLALRLLLSDIRLRLAAQRQSGLQTLESGALQVTISELIFLKL